jgi:hypothetical protein
MSNKDNYNLLIDKLDAFIRKYYVNQLIRGGLYTLALVLLLFLGLNFLEYYFYFRPGIKEALFFSFLGVSCLSLFVLVIKPLMHFFKLGKIISHEQAARIIGDHFSDVKDKLLNVLQLRSQADTAISRELIIASVNQKSDEIRLVPFKQAIDLRKNRKYARYVLPPFLLLIVLLFAAPSLITDSTTRLLKYNQAFEKPAPFRFLIQNKSLDVVQYGEFPLEVKIEGEALPNEVFIMIDDLQFRLSKVDNSTFTYTFSNVQKDTPFNLFSGEVRSKEYELIVLKKPSLSDFQVKLNYPDYTGLPDEELSSIGDLYLPAGTYIDWVFNTENTDAIGLVFSGQKERIEARRFSDNLFTHRKRAMSDESYKLFISSSSLKDADSIGYSISVIPDLYPVIKVDKFQDSLNNKLIYFAGEASDDYGLVNLTFNYRIKTDDKEGDLKSEKIVLPTGKNVDYTHVFDLQKLGLKPGDEVIYYFEVFDNDAVNGSKSSRTSLMVYAMPTVEQFEKMAEQNDNAIRELLKKSFQESKKLQEDMSKLYDRLLQKKELDWQSRKELEKLLERQKELEKNIEDAKQTLQENIKNAEEFAKPDEEVEEKQERLQELMDNAIPEEIKELMKQIEELMQELQKDNALEMMEEFKANEEQMELKLDRMLDLFQQLELENEMKQAVEKLRELADTQEEVAEETRKADDKQKNMSPDEKDASQKELEQKQNEVNKKFDEIDKKYEDIRRKNQEMRRSKNIDDKREEREDIKEDLKDSKESIQQNQNQKANRKQKSAAEKMREMAGSMSSQMSGQQMEQMQMDMKAMRQLLENLVTLSFDQESLMQSFGPVEINTPKYVSLTQQQKNIQDNFKVVEDSLHELSKRVIQMESFLTEKVGDIKSNMRRSLDFLEERQKPQSLEQQQRAMKNLNDLALMLNEVMQNMQMKMAGMMSGNQQCDSPGDSPGNEPKDKISEGQKELNEGLKKMKEGLEKGMGGSAKDFAQMAARQAALRKALREKQKQLQQQGQGNQELEEIMEQMNKVETELVNKRLSNESIKRQQDILTRLLEHEKAEREREYDNKRKSETATEKQRRMPPSLEEYLKKREAEIEMFKTVNPSLKPYYKNLVEEYYKSIKSEK